MTRRAWFAFAAACLATGGSVRALPAQDASGVYERFADRVWKVDILEIQTSASNEVGTGFAIGDRGLVVTGYHVVADYVAAPDEYRLQLTHETRPTRRDPAILAVDPVNDLAVLKLEADDAPAAGRRLELATELPPMGTRLFSLGHPGDLATAVVEGTYNGLVPSAAVPRMHFTGSVNPGMSGGPTITAAGEVVGVNVSTAGDQLSFLVPAERVATLLESLPEEGAEPSALEAQVATRLHDFQTTFYDWLLQAPFGFAGLGDFGVPVPPDPTFDCTASPWDTRQVPYRVVQYQCGTVGNLFIAGSTVFPVLTLQHLLIAGEDLGREPLHALVSSQFAAVWDWEVPTNERATDYECEHGNVRNGRDLKMRTVVCARRHKGEAALFDLFYRSATLTGADQEVVTTATAYGLAFGNLKKLARALIEGISWIR